MKTIKLTQGEVALVDDADYTYLSRHKWHVVKSQPGNGQVSYAKRKASVSEKRKHWHIRMHRCILDVPDGLQIHHINGNGLDNRRSNLQICTHAENMRNHRGAHSRKSKTGFRGVRFQGTNSQRPYRADIYLGCYETAEAAAKAYDAAAVKCHGDFALTNNMLGLI